ncbi:BlaI/MecI/CopY family transcriptional regulator [Dinghuibacter silviterrae]|uniref:Putative transcriptional regulator n=1 Tax=Dinghuibacter silviterrae TaxID=1539049 RepID=A0A4R8DES3_9BACT|nr:BlaI/MecI/CopY family transcriptional regulator [Dinghuibacter silviterrae]TDW96059.1 putative transcriptional regulator [Dinghuibacter silviterrae]
MEKLSPQEEDAMKAIWKTGEGTIKAFLDHVDSPAPPYTTLASTVKNLEKKRFVTSRLMGKVYIYKATMTEEEYKNRFMTGFVKDYFANSYKEMVNFFVEKKKLSPAELKEILHLIEKGRS